MEKIEISADELILDLKKRGHRIVRLIRENGQDLNRYHPFIRKLTGEGIIWYQKGDDFENKEDYEIDLSQYKVNYSH